MRDTTADADAAVTRSAEGRLVLVRAPFGRDAGVLVELARRYRLEAQAADSTEALVQALERPFGCVVLSEEALTPEAGAAMAEAVERQPFWSATPVLALLADPSRPPEGLLRLRRVEDRLDLVMLQRPARGHSVAGVLFQLLEARERQYRIRDQLETLAAQEEHLRFLLAELDHRVKNVLAKVLSIARMTRKESDDLVTFSNVFDERVAALARAHDLLACRKGGRATLGALLREALTPFTNGGGSNVSLSGPEAPLSPQSGLTLAMTFHELATNAAKYGALSTSDGRVEVTWTLRRDDEGEALTVEWRESGGPPVSPPSRRSFGSRMIEQIAAQELQGRSELRFETSGVVWRLEVPVPEPAAEEAAAASVPRLCAPGS